MMSAGAKYSSVPSQVLESQEGLKRPYAEEDNDEDNRQTRISRRVETPSHSIDTESSCDCSELESQEGLKLP